MKFKNVRKALSMILSLCLMLQVGIPAVYAGESNLQVITGFAILSEDVEKITVAVGTEEAEVLGKLPDTLVATTTGSAIDVILEDITWDSDEDFSTETEGEFIFTAKLADASYILAEGVKMPTITVDVVNDQPALRGSMPAPTWPEGMQIDGAVYGGNITEWELNFEEGFPSVMTQYQAGDGYVLFTPLNELKNKPATIELNNATMTSGNSAIWLPGGEVTLVIRGDNELKDSIGLEGVSNGITGNNTQLRIEGNGTLSAEGYGIYLGGTSSLTHAGNDTYKLNLLTYTEYTTDRIEIDVIGTVIFSGELDSWEDAELAIWKGSQLTLQKPQGLANEYVIWLTKNMNIGENAKLVINEETFFVIVEDSSSPHPVIENKGSIVVKGTLVFTDGSYLGQIAKMNIITEGNGRVIFANEGGEYPIDPATGNLMFNDWTGESLNAENGGVYVCGSGTMRWEPVVDGSESLIGGTITLNNADIKIKDAQIEGAAIRVDADNDRPITLHIIGNNTIDNPYGDAIDIANLLLTGSGTLTVKGNVVYASSFDKSEFTGSLNAIVLEVSRGEWGDTYSHGTVYGTVSYTEGEGDSSYTEYTSLTVAEGAKLTIELGITLYTDELTNNGTVINNATLCLQREVSDEEELKIWVYDELNLEGNGMVRVYESHESWHTSWPSALFTNGGKLINEHTQPLDFASATEDMGNLDEEGYHWDWGQKKITLQDLIMYGDKSVNEASAIKLPEGEDVTIELKGTSKITGFATAIYQGDFKDSDDFEEIGSLTICGDGTLIATEQSNNQDILTTTGKFILESGNLILISRGKSRLLAGGIEIKGGSIGHGNMSAPICSMGDFTMSGGKVISDGKTLGQGAFYQGLEVYGDLTLSGGELIIGLAYNSIIVYDGNVTISGGKLIAHNDVSKSIAGIAIQITGEEDKKILISGGTVDIKAGMAALFFMTKAEGGGKGIFETNGMTVTTNPKGGTLKSLTAIVPVGPDGDESITIYSLTADKKLKMGGAMLSNACTSLTVVKDTVTPGGGKPSEGDTPGSGGVSDGGTSSSGGALPTVKKTNVPTTVTTLVSATVTSGTAHITVSQTTVADAINKAQTEAKKNGTEKNGIVVEIKSDTKNNTVSNLSANLPMATIDELVKAGVKEFRINSDVGTISLDFETLKTIQKETNSDVNLSAKKVDTNTLSEEAKAMIGNRPVFDFTITGANGEKITEFGRGQVAISIPYALGVNEKAKNVVAYYIDDEGKLHEVPNSVYDEKSKMLSFVTNHFSMYAVGYKDDQGSNDVEAMTFTDIATHWAKKDIEFVTAKGLFGGTAEGIFSPNMSMTRGMLVTVLGRLDKADLSSYTASSFIDVKTDTYYMPAIEWARKGGIVNGLSATEFAPNLAITREQMAVIIANYAKASGFELPELQAENNFADSKAISDYAKVAVKQMQMAGIISGREDNTFDPKGTATRAEVSAVLKRLIELIEKK